MMSDFTRLSKMSETSGSLDASLVLEQPGYIRDDEIAAEYIQQIDMSSIRKFVQLHLKRNGIECASHELSNAELKYRRWLLLKRIYFGEPLPPTEEIDDFWHSHLLHTEQYVRDSLMIFGEYLHHFPYFGIRSDEDHEDLIDAFDATKRLYLQHFGESIEA